MSPRTLFVGGPPPYMPPCVPWWVYTLLPCLPVYPGRCTRPCTCPVHGRCDTAVPSSTAGMTVIPGVSKRLGLSLRKEASFTLRINPSHEGNRHRMTNKPATESTSVQGMSETLNPSGTDTKPPSRLGAASSRPGNEGKSPLSWPLFLTKSD